MPVSATYLPSSLLLDSTLSPFPGSTPYPPAKQWKKNSFVQQTAYTPLPRLQHPQRGSPFVCPTPGLSPFRSLFPSKNIPRSHFLPKLRYPSYSQSHPKALRPDGVHWNGRNGCSVYTTYPPGLLPGRRVNSLDTPLSPFLLYFAYGSPRGV
jgi:hypothetical protein